nr:UDP-glucose flavonoid 3-O-glucosyltransferase 7-like [Ziziphus jujuba var. spinosa]
MINILTFQIPSLINSSSSSSSSIDAMLASQLDQFLKRHRPDFLVADMFFPWATDVASPFYELEPVYADHYWNGFGVRARHIGPLHLYSKQEETSIDDDDDDEEHYGFCLNWLDSKQPRSVVHDFIWVVVKQKHDEEDWIPKGFEKRMEGKGLRGIPRQAKILIHETVGGFVKKIGFLQELGVKKEEIEKGVRKIMVAEEGEEIRNRVKALREVAKRAIEEGGSPYVDLNAALEEMKLRKMAHR